MSCLLFTLALQALRLTQAYFDCPNPRQHIIAQGNTDAMLPCSFLWRGEPSEEWKVVWQKEEDEDELVVHYQNGADQDDKQNQRFHSRTFIRKDWFGQRNATLRLSRVSSRDSGAYQCYLMGIPVGPGPMIPCCRVTLEVYQAQKEERKSFSREMYICFLVWALVSSAALLYVVIKAPGKKQTITFFLMLSFILGTLLVYFINKGHKT
ncbi:CD276 antigen-like [Xenopus tropicalis]|uniref:CD276 antigen-like n=1 Tax=Xenopus tropicalis TaxID=8364 RepID=A0A8J1JTJ8_XENTR|nr:CD276 antigen-like [Xenopus tropicalis]XP_031759902.1 CD276 antigen-like [Xenopus tropicalis]